MAISDNFDRGYIASDHAGFDLKVKILEHFKTWGLEDLGPFSDDSVDYPDYANKVAEKVEGERELGILICGSGQGMAMRANKYNRIRAALVYDEASCALSRQHNKANVICLGSRLLNPNKAFELIQLFVDTAFEGGRHGRRVHKLKGE